MEGKSIILRECNAVNRKMNAFVIPFMKLQAAQTAQSERRTPSENRYSSTNAFQTLQSYVFNPTGGFCAAHVSQAAERDGTNVDRSVVCQMRAA